MSRLRALCHIENKSSEPLNRASSYLQESIRRLLTEYLGRFSQISGNLINCGPVLNWLELDNRGRRLLVPDGDNCPINTPAVAAAYAVKRYTAQAGDEISFEVCVIKYICVLLKHSLVHKNVILTKYLHFLSCSGVRVRKLRCYVRN